VRLPQLPLPGRIRGLSPTVVTAAVTVTLLAGSALGASQLVADHHLAGRSHLVAAVGPTGAPAPTHGATSTLHSSAPVEPTVAPLRRLETADLLIVSSHPLPLAEVRAVARLAGVRGAELADEGRVALARHPAEMLGVIPSTFRAWTPLYTARSDALWQSVARGDTAVSFDIGHDARLPLGGTVPVAGRHQLPIRIGAFASVGIAGVDAIVTDTQARRLGLVHGNALVVSAPGVDPTTLRQEVADLIPHAGHVELLRPVIVVRDAGEFLTRAQINTVLRAAWSRLGLPYVWGATGPLSFDCSGLVQWSYARAGILLPRTAAEQFLTGPHIPLADARPGDLLFWTYDPTAPGFVDHVALYVGNGMMVVAPHTGDVVSYAPVPLADLAGVVRVDPAF